MSVGGILGPFLSQLIDSSLLQSTMCLPLHEYFVIILVFSKSEQAYL